MKRVIYGFLSFLLVANNIQAEINIPGGGGGGGGSLTTYNDDVPLYLGTDNDVEMVFDTNTSGDQLWVNRFLESNGSTQIPVVVFGDASLTDAVLSTTWDNVTSPTLAVYSDAGTNYISMLHDGTAGRINTDDADGILFSSNIGIGSMSTAARLLHIEASDTPVVKITDSGTASTYLFVNATGLHLNTDTGGINLGLGAPEADSIKATLNSTGVLSHVVTTLTIADDGAGTSPAGTITPASNYIEIDCQDANNCTASLSETGAVEGSRISIEVISTGTVAITDTAGVSEMSGNFTMGQYDVINFHYNGSQWTEESRSNN